MIKSFTTLCISLFLSLTVTCQVNYDDVAVIINDSSPTSVNIGNYFQAQRGIPALNMIHISAPTTEEIDSLEFEAIREQIELYITSNGLTSSLNYLVTTKGVPLKVNRGDCTSLSDNCASFDSEITLILGSGSSFIGQNGSTPNPFLGSPSHFSSVSEGMYLVTRLSAYTEAEVLALIDRGGNDTPVSMLSSKFIFDISGSMSLAELTLFTGYLQLPSNNLVANGWNSLFHPDAALLTNVQNVMGYVSLNMDPANDVLNHSWANGAIADLYNSYTASTFDASANINNDLIVANLISEGASGAHGRAYPLYATDKLEHVILFNRYLDTIGNFNMAEAFYSSMKSLSASSIVIGDPKTSIILDNTASLNESDVNLISIFPNPSNGIVTILSPVELKRIGVVNMQGQLLYSSTENLQAPIDLSLLSAGTYFIRIESESGWHEEKLILLQ
jgi:uncharacterized protein (TIGR03790 family)